MRHAKPVTPPVRGTRYPTSVRCLFGCAGCAGLALVLFTAHVFAPAKALPIVAMWLLSATLLAAWVAILTWRMPVFRRCILAAFGGLWIAGIGLSVWLILLSIAGNRSAAWQRSVQALALGLSFVVGGLLLRALLRTRASPLVGRLLSLLSPLAVLLLILFVPPGQ